ncbi:MAG: hypothetical protein C4294_02335, partial [Nitrospiraceae bacterium]
MPMLDTSDTRRSLSILYVSTADILGGAESVASSLLRMSREHGYRSWLAVGRQYGDNPYLLRIPNDANRTRWARGWIKTGQLLSPFVGKVGGIGRVRRLVQLLGEPRRLWSLRYGHEDFEFPGTWRLLEITPQRPDIVHCHNLHGGYFDLRAISWLSHQVPLILTLHDAWLLSGHCSHSFGCERWKTGCGHCSDLTIYPAIRRDATAYNWQRKKDIYARSRLYVATPCRWLLEKVTESILAPAICESRVIPNGVDLSIFRPVDKQAVRAMLGIQPDAKVVLCAGVSIT